MLVPLPHSPKHHEQVYSLELVIVQAQSLISFSF